VIRRARSDGVDLDELARPAVQFGAVVRDLDPLSAREAEDVVGTEIADRDLLSADLLDRRDDASVCRATT